MQAQPFIEDLSRVGKQVLPKDASLWLYGSRARGNAHDGSDWDVLILLNKEKQELNDFDEYSYPLIDFGALNGEIVSAQIYTQKEWKSMSYTPFYKNVERDKIVIL
ncbi:MAG: nucleotidyltransferase domain-containing protein [Paludibacteraceae bacterium]|nr:nucleotidyltransferase domain-containing protein [Paludibacteraceae bacterium]